MRFLDGFYVFLIKGWHIFLLVLASSTFAHGQIYFDTYGDSRLWLEGSSTLHRFDCAAKSIQGIAFLMSDTEMKTSDNEYGTVSEGYIEAEKFYENEGISGIEGAELRWASMGTDSLKLHVGLNIPIKSFDCGHSRMNRDMYDALRSEEYDYITFQLDDVELLEGAPDPGNSSLQKNYRLYRIGGLLNVAGVDRHITFAIQVQQKDSGKYHIMGQKEISMPDYEIEPPTALRGLIRTHEDLTVFFDLFIVEKNMP